MLFDFQKTKIFGGMEIQPGNGCPGTPVGLLHIFSAGVEVCLHLVAVLQVAGHLVQCFQRFDGDEGFGYPAFCTLSGCTLDLNEGVGKTQIGQELAVLAVGAEGMHTIARNKVLFLPFLSKSGHKVYPTCGVNNSF